MINSRLLLLALPLALAACLPPAEDAPPPVMPEDACGANGLQDLLGQPVAALTPMTLRQPVRVISPGQPVTMDYQAERLNVELNASKVITRVSCG